MSTCILGAFFAVEIKFHFTVLQNLVRLIHSLLGGGNQEKLLKKKNLWLNCVAYGILVPQPGIEPMPPALKVWSLNHWTAGKVPKSPYFSEVHSRYLKVK